MLQKGLGDLGEFGCVESNSNDTLYCNSIKRKRVENTVRTGIIIESPDLTIGEIYWVNNSIIDYNFGLY